MLKIQPVLGSKRKHSAISIRSLLCATPVSDSEATEVSRTQSDALLWCKHLLCSVMEKWESTRHAPVARLDVPGAPD